MGVCKICGVIYKDEQQYCHICGAKIVQPNDIIQPNNLVKYSESTQDNIIFQNNENQNKTVTYQIQSEVDVRQKFDNRKAVMSFILSLLGLAACFIGIPVQILSLALGIHNKSEQKYSGFSIAGITISIIGLIISIALLALMIFNIDEIINSEFFDGFIYGFRSAI